MIDFNFDAYCCGCKACANLCPTKAIMMQSNIEGFCIPIIDINKCTNCGLCEKVCPHLNNSWNKRSNVNVAGIWLYASSDNDAKMRSSSGGAFYEIAKKALSEDNLICGCIWNDKIEAVHIIGKTIGDLEKMQGSKYVQSDMEDCYNFILKALKQGKKVVFSGTPCQATALHNCVINLEAGKYRNNLLNIAVICHGIASPMAWNSYKKWEEKKQGSRLVNVNFRDKSQEGYKKSYCRYEYASGNIVYMPTFLPSSPYMEAAMVYNLAIRKCCSACDCKGVNEAIDLIIGDWYAENEGEGALGTSCICAFTDRGRKRAEKHLKNLRPFSFDQIVKHNNFITNSVKLGKKRNEFFNKISDCTAWENIERLYPPKYKVKKVLVKVGLYETIKKYI